MDMEVREYAVEECWNEDEQAEEHQFSQSRKKRRRK